MTKHLQYDLGSPADSWYEATASRPSFNASLPEGDTVTADICVVGGGFTGISAALELALQGRKVVVIESRTIGFGASGRNGGQIIGGFHHGYGDIGKHYGNDIRDACFAISEEGKALIADRIKKYQIDCHLQWGYTHLATKPRHLKEMESDLRDWQSLGYQHGQLLSVGEIRGKLGSDSYVGGLHDAYSGHMHPLKYLLGIAKQSVTQGVTIYENTHATHIDCDKGEVHCGDGRLIRASHVIIAGNAYIHLKPLVAGLYRRIMPVVSNIAATAPLNQSQREQIVRDNDAYADYNFIVDYFRMSHDNRLLFGGRASYGGSDPKDLRAWMQKRMVRVFSACRSVGLDFVWGGNIGITMSRYPDVGKIGKVGFYAQGYSGHGVLLSNMCGKILAHAVLGSQDKFDVLNKFDVLAGFKHRNFPGGTFRRAVLMLGMLYYRLHDAL